MKNIVAFLELPGVYDYPLSKDDYRRSYMELGVEVQKLGHHFFIVRGQSTYEGDGFFSQSWQYDGMNLVESGRVQADVVFDKGEFMTDGSVAVFNTSFINEICTNKWLTYNLFTGSSPASWLVQNAQELSSVLGQVKTTLAVAKPIDGQEGKDVYICTKDELLTKKYVFPILIQEFLDSSCGIPGIVDGTHDLRIAIINGEMIYSYFRTPPSGSLLANVARGGRFAMVNIETIPAEVKKLVSSIDKTMSFSEQRFYGIDVAMTKQGPMIIEMNSRLGLLPNSDHPVFIEVKKRLAKIFVELATARPL